MHGLVLAGTLLAATPAIAHTGVGGTSGLAAGLLHPITGLDHLLAMLAIGLWAGLLGGAARLATPCAFLLAMAAGAVLAVRGIELPLVEAGILASVIVVGALTAVSLHLKPLAGAALAALFGLLHGHAHGTEMVAEDAVGYGLGFLAATAALHGLGVLLSGHARATTRTAVRMAGGAIATAGIVLAVLA
ncbi:HupE/UreJ family protein [Elioraea sp.]|uniref:HupE/UreJ family protein n=1 Tax=Elioraea sp. TaxID=2185103 RepID=UPI003F6EEB60